MSSIEFHIAKLEDRDALEFQLKENSIFHWLNYYILQKTLRFRKSLYVHKAF